VLRTLLACLVLAAAAGAAPAGAGERCGGLDPDRADGLFGTVSPFEHGTSARTQLFPATCAVGPGAQAVRVREAPGRYATPYIAATRRRDELFVYGYADAPDPGGFVAAVDPGTLRERWRTAIPDRRPAGQWSYPGVLAVHGNGALYAVYGNVLVKLSARTGAVLARRDLPEDPAGTGAAYNGLVVLPHGRIVTKGIERGPCAATDALGGLSCSVANALPTPLVVLEPDRLRILSRAVTPEPVTGRITAHRLGGADFVYVAGRDTLRRFRVARRTGRLALDPRWGPVRYRTGASQPGTGPGVLGGFLVVQTNFLPSPEPLTVTAVSLRDSRRVFRIQPFAGSGAPRSFIVSKAALDAANATVVTHDTAVGRMAALRLHPRRGFRVRWSRPLTSAAFSALVGDRRRRQVVIPDFTGGVERVRWLDLATGATRATSPSLGTAAAPGNIVTPGFARRHYHVSIAGVLRELRPAPAR
jgi:hypothetical protein